MSISRSLILKEEYAKEQILLYTYKGKLEAKLVTNNAKESAFNIKLSRAMNEVPTLEFDYPFRKNSKLDLETSCDKLLYYRDWYYIIKSVEVDDSNLRIHIKAYGEEEELKYCYCECINEIGKTVKQCFETIMNSTTHPVDSGYKFLGTDIPDTKMRHLITEEECSIYENLMSLCDVFQCWLEFKLDENGNKGIYFRSQSIKDNKILKNTIDLKELKISYSTEEIFTRLLPYGAADEVTGNELNIIEVNPTGKAYLENTAYYYGILGIPDEVIKKEAKYQNIKIWTDDTIIDKKYLMEMAQQELDKCCFPELEATLTVRNLSKLLGSSRINFKIGQEIIAINKELDFRIQFRVVGIEEDGNDILNDTITISNKINIDTRFQNLQHTSDTVDKITNTNPYDTDGNLVGDGEPYLDMNRLKDGVA